MRDDALERNSLDLENRTGGLGYSNELEDSLRIQSNESYNGNPFEEGMELQHQPIADYNALQQTRKATPNPTELQVLSGAEMD